MKPYRFEKMKEDYLDEVLQIYTYYVLNTTATFHANPPTREEMRELVFFTSKKIYDLGTIRRKYDSRLCFPKPAQKAGSL